MDLGGLHGFNGSMLDPMKMTDAELLDNPDDDDDVMNGVFSGSNAGVLQTPEKLSLEGDDDTSEDKDNEGLMEALGDVKTLEAVDAMNAAVAGLRSDADLAAKDAEIQNLKEANGQLVETNRELKDKVDLHEDELTDLREQFGAIEKENDSKNNKVKSLESMVETLQVQSAKDTGADETAEKVKQLEDKIEKDKVDKEDARKRNQDAIGNKNQKIATLNEELGKLKEDVAAKDVQNKEQENKHQELEAALEKTKGEILSMTNLVSKYEADLEEQKMKGVSAEAKETEISKLQEEITKLKAESGESKLALETEVKRLSDLALKADDAEKESTVAHESLQKHVEEKKLEMTKMQCDLKEANDMVQDSQMALKAEKDKSEVVQARLEGDKSGLVVEMNKTQMEKDTVSAELEKLTNEKESLAKELDTLQKQISELGAAAGNSAKVVEEKKALAEKCNKLEMEAFELTRTCNELKQMVPKVTMLEGQVKEMDSLKAELTAKNAELQTMKAEAHTAKEQISNLLQSNEKLIQTAFENRTNHKTSLDNLSRECTTLKKAVNDKEKLFIEARRRNEELEKSRSNEGAMAAQMIPQLQMAHRNEVEQFKRQLDSLSGEVSSWQKWKMEDDKQKAMTSSQVESLTKVLVETKQEALTFKKDLDVKVGEIKSCHMRIGELTKNLGIKINECETLKAIEKGMEKVKKETDHSRAEAEAFRNEAAKYRMDAEKSDNSQKELAKEATKMLKMLQDKDELIRVKDKAFQVLRTQGQNMARVDDTDRKLQESRKDYLILEKESQFQKKQVEQTKREVDFLKKENFKLDKEMQKMRKEQPIVIDESSDQLLKDLNEAQRQLAESSSELNQLKKENATTSKKIIDFEKENKKLVDNNKQLNADLGDERAKVMVLCELREEEGLDDPLPPQKNVRGPPKSEVSTSPLTKAKNMKRTKSMPAKIVEEDSEDDEPKEEPDVSLIQVKKPDISTKETPAKKAVKGKTAAKPIPEKVPEKPKKGKGRPAKGAATSSSESSQSVVELKTDDEPEVSLVAVARKRGRPEKDPVQEVLEYLAREEKRKSRVEGKNGSEKEEDPEPEPEEEVTVKAVKGKAAQKKREDESPPEDDNDEKSKEKKGKTNKRKAEEESTEQPGGKKGKKNQMVEQAIPKDEDASLKKGKINSKKEIKSSKKGAAPPKPAPSKVVASKAKESVPAKKGKVKKVDSKNKPVKEPEVLAPRKGKGTKAAAIIAAINEASDHEADPETDTKKGKGKKKETEKKPVPPSKKDSPQAAKKPGRKPAPPPPQKKMKKS